MVSSTTPVEHLVTGLAAASNTPDRRRLLLAARDLVNPALVSCLCEQARSRLRADLASAASLSEAAHLAACQLRSPASQAESLRMKGHVAYLSGDYRGALAAYERAIRILDSLNQSVDAARTLSSALQTLIYLGRYQQAIEWAQRARGIFEQAGDRLRLARLDSNLANLLHRQDKYEEAIGLYRRAHRQLRAEGDKEAAAITLSNMAVCYMGLYDFPRALAAYKKARAFGQDNGMPLFAAEVANNIAYLYFLRGDYLEAMKLYQAENASPQDAAPYLAVSKLDQSDLYLELNLFAEAQHLAEQALVLLKDSALHYEAAKATLNLAVCAIRTGDSKAAMLLLLQARRLFRQEANQAWAAVADLYRAVLCLNQDAAPKALRLCAAARSVLTASSLKGKEISATLLLARIHRQNGDMAAARAHCQDALRLLQHVDSSALRFEVNLLAGQNAEAGNDSPAALAAYRNAERSLERLRGHLQHDELKIAFLSDKVALYEGLFLLALRSANSKSARSALQCVEKAKSRSLADTISFQTKQAARRHLAPAREAKAAEAAGHRLTWYHHQLERMERRNPSPPPEALSELRQKIWHAELEVQSTLSALRRVNPLAAGWHTGASVRISEVLSLLGPERVLLEYFECRQQLYTFVVTRNRIRVMALGPASAAAAALRMLRFQLARQALAPSFPPPGDSWQAATDSHLKRLYDLLLRPLATSLTGKHLVIVPHGALHALPFHALHDGEKYLIEECPVTYAPSASVYYLCSTKRSGWNGRALVLAVPDDKAPEIQREAEIVAQTLTKARLLSGAEATGEALEKLGHKCRYIHLATHGFFRQDNPLFSGIRLGQSRLSVHHLHDLSFHADLITLSGCATGLSEAVAGDELLGFTRGLLYAGAHSVQAALWNVYDRSTALYMSNFYRELRHGAAKEVAAQKAMLQVRQQYPHPYFWAPFTVTGAAGAGI